MDNRNKLLIISEMIKQINDVTKKMESNILFFSETHQKLRSDIENEAAYYVNIDYFYGLFFERCDIYREFIMQKILLFDLEYEKVKSSLTLIHDLRTYKSHTLDKAKVHDNSVIERVEKWHFRLIGSKRIGDGDYLVCSNELIDLAKNILDAMLYCIEQIGRDSRKEQMIHEMLMAKDSYCPDFYIESQFKEIMTTLEVKADAHVLTKTYGKNIRNKMKLFSSLSPEEHKEKIGLLIEQILFSKDINICPLGGKRIMEEFGLIPGKELGNLKRKAIELSQEDPYRSEEQLLILLKDWKESVD